MYDAWRLKAKLRARELAIGTWVTYTDPCVTETLCDAGFDFLIIDGEHTQMDMETLMSHVMTCRHTETAPIIRVPLNDPVHIKRALDLGAAGILVPQMRSAEEVEAAVAACRYPPKGIRGFGPRRATHYYRFKRAYGDIANASVTVIAQVEHIDAVRDIERFVRVEGVDAVLIGSDDLSASLGVLGQPEHPDVLAAIDRTLAAASEAGVSVGIVGPNDIDVAWRWIEKGMTFVSVGSDAGFVTSLADRTMEHARSLAPATTFAASPAFGRRFAGPSM